MSVYFDLRSGFPITQIFLNPLDLLRMEHRTLKRSQISHSNVMSLRIAIEAIFIGQSLHYSMRTLQTENRGRHSS